MKTALFSQPSRICFSAELSMRPPTPKILASMLTSGVDLELPGPKTAWCDDKCLDEYFNEPGPAEAK